MIIPKKDLGLLKKNTKKITFVFIKIGDGIKRWQQEIEYNTVPDNLSDKLIKKNTYMYVRLQPLPIYGR